MSDNLEVRELSHERDHRVSAVWDGDATEGWDGSRDDVGRKESENTDHGQSSVVDLGNQAAFLGFLGHFLVEAKGIVQVKDGVDVITEQVE